MHFSLLLSLHSPDDMNSGNNKTTIYSNSEPMQAHRVRASMRVPPSMEPNIQFSRDWVKRLLSRNEGGIALRRPRAIEEVGVHFFSPLLF